MELIRITDLCEAFGSLPQAGGVLDQDPLLLQAMTYVMTVKAEKLQMDQEEARSRNAIRKP